jgi:predicted signal transduction protein with EAL and GGDEF domain
MTRSSNTDVALRLQRPRDDQGSYRHYLVLKFPFRGAAGVGYPGGVALNVTARIQAEEELRHHAANDQLTGLPNRTSFVKELELAIQKSLKDRRK